MSSSAPQHVLTEKDREELRALAALSGLEISKPILNTLVDLIFSGAQPKDVKALVAFAAKRKEAT
jgi:hypothetical protein